jgi:hypothetical protein
VEHCRRPAGRSLSPGLKKRRRRARRLGIGDWGTTDRTESRSGARASPRRTEGRQGLLGHSTSLWSVPCPSRAGLGAENIGCGLSLYSKMIKLTPIYIIYLSIYVYILIVVQKTLGIPRNTKASL